MFHIEGGIEMFVIAIFAEKMIVDLCPSPPALYPFYKRGNDTVVVVDVFRASATMCAILHNGATAIIPVADIEEAKRYKSEEFLVGAERDTRKCDFADFGNSPFDYIREKLQERKLCLPQQMVQEPLRWGVKARNYM